MNREEFVSWFNNKLPPEKYNLKLLPPSGYSNWQEEKERIIKFVEKYGFNIIPYDFNSPLSDRLRFFYCVKTHYFLYMQYYKHNLARKNQLAKSGVKKT